MAKATERVSTPPTSASGISHNSRDRALVEAFKHIVVCDDAIDELMRRYGDDHGDREDSKSWEAQRNEDIETLVNTPASTAEGLRAKASAMQIRTIADSYEDHGGIGTSLAADVLRTALLKDGAFALSSDIYEDVLHLIAFGAAIDRMASSFPAEDDNTLFYTLGAKIMEHAKAIQNRLHAAHEE
ncbi:hypothetical protein [Bradyrhizobium guangdongense]|uniref:Uncharacterized protein n=1 Tax=Bradyrhizobium guangdongense TaxID=1325090 RepID=A0A410V7J2_9BRAD|nr:hypothetical protein [Bradyrhizobium guangdongense]QAU39600.1 hypothetical protein X265_19480 [Bradyrhizobium guangdongense]QOZ60662.1 hypothetical protein XH86_19495 [Bradyrhizobium guangdongense]GGI24161.1 hypothetical protein GCM10010987_28000 [Bradyrhizobium guangdongense]